MSQNIVINGTNYNGVPSIEVPLQTSGNASFVDTSDADAAMEDIAQGKTAYVNGVKLTGTASGGSVTVEALSVTANGTYTAPTGTAYSPVTVNVEGIEFLWPSEIFIETIEANNITNTTNAKAYFDNKYNPYKFALLLSPLTVNNQMVCMGVHTSRWRNGNIAGTSIGTNYDGKLVEGTQYLILRQ